MDLVLGKYLLEAVMGILLSVRATEGACGVCGHETNVNLGLHT